MEEKGKKVFKRFKHDQLVEYHSLPGYLKDNAFILGSYRSEWPLKRALLSIFSIHNETLNVWTHLIGFFIFLSLTICTAVKIPNVVELDSLQHVSGKIQAELLNCLSSFPNVTNLGSLKDGLIMRASLPSDFLSSLSGWQISELVINCLPKQLLFTTQKDASALHSVRDQDMAAGVVIQQAMMTRWPFFAFLGGAMFCLLASSSCHLLACHSERLRYVMLRIDYTGIAALITTSFYPPVYYTFMCQPFFCSLYLGTITLFGIATMVFSLLPAFQKPHFRCFRTSLFFAMGISGVGPVIHKLMLYGDQPEALETTGYEVLMGLLYGVGAFVYVMRVPERWKPGKFDIFCSSHQIFHVFVVLGAYTHYHNGLIYLKWRDTKGC